MVYVIDLGNGYYKIGATKDLNKRRKVYETGMIHKSKIVFYFETENLSGLEMCIKGLLHNYGIKKKKEVYTIELTKIIYAIKYCSRGIKNIKCEKCNNIQNTKSFGRHIRSNHRDIYKGVVIINK